MMYSKDYCKLPIQNHLIDDSYINSFLYYLVTGRKGAWIYKTDHCFTAVCQHPHLVGTLLVFPEVGAGSYQFTAGLLQHLYKSGHRIQLARYSEDNVDALRHALSNLDHNLVDTLKHVPEDVMDWKYPAHILDTELVSGLKGNAFEKIRTKINKASRTITVQTLSKVTAIKDMKAALKFWEGNMIISDKDTEDMAEFYHEFFRIIGNYNGRYEGMMFYDGKRPVGFSVWEPLSSDTANSFINLADTTITGLSELQTVSVCRYLSEQGIKFMNLGGSETENLDRFKTKFLPCKSLNLHSYEVIYKDFGLPENASYFKIV